MEKPNITGAESGGNPNAKNPNSSALGLGQFVNGTWLDMIRRYRPDLTQGKSNAEILELRKDPVLSQQMTDAYAAENQAKLSHAGLPVTPGSTYLMHFAGPGGGIALMKAAPNTPVESILDSKAINANPFLKGKTADWVIDWANKRMAKAATAKSSVAPKSAPLNGKSTIPYLAQTQAADPAFGATNWPRRPTSPNTLPPDAVRPFAGAPRVAPAPFVDGTMKAQPALDNSLPAPGAAPWDLSNRFGTWDTINGVSGPVRSGTSGGPGQTGDAGPAALGGATPERFAIAGNAGGLAPQSDELAPPLPSNSDRASVRRLSSPMLDNLRGDPNQPPFDTDSTPYAGLPWLALPPTGQSPFDRLLAPDRNSAPGDWFQPLPFRPTPSLTQIAPGGIPGLMQQLGAFDPSNPDQPPAGGLMRLIRDYMRDNPDGSAMR